MAKPKTIKPVEELRNKMLLTLHEASFISGLGVNTIRKMTKEGGCKFVFMNGRNAMVKREEFEQFIHESERR